MVNARTNALSHRHRCFARLLPGGMLCIWWYRLARLWDRGMREKSIHALTGGSLLCRCWILEWASRRYLGPCTYYKDLGRFHLGCCGFVDLGVRRFLFITLGQNRRRKLRGNQSSANDNQGTNSVGYVVEENPGPEQQACRLVDRLRKRYCAL